MSASAVPDDEPDMLFSDALPAEVVGAYSGATEVVVESVAPTDVCIRQTFDAGGESTLLWSSAVVLAQRWACNEDDSLPVVGRGSRVLELGAGLGLNAIGLAAMGAAVTATEIEPALTALRESVERNRACWEATGSVESIELRWGEEPLISNGGPFDAVICADCIYSRPLRPLLLQTLRQVCTEGTAVVFACEARGDEEAFVAEVAHALGARADCVYGPDDRTVQIHVLSPLSSAKEAIEPLRFMDLPDELVLEVARSLLATNAVQSALRLAATSSTAHMHLVAARREAKLRRLQWSAELSRHLAAQAVVQDIHRSNDGRQAVALASNTSIVGPELVATTGRISWTIKIDRCIRNVIRVGVCHAWPTEAAQCFGFYRSCFQQMVWDRAGRLDFGRGALPGKHPTKVWSRLPEGFELKSIQCMLDRDEGAFYINLNDAVHSEDDTGGCDPPGNRDSEHRCGNYVRVLWGIPPGAVLRPWVHLSNRGDAVTFDGVFCRVDEPPSKGPAATSLVAPPPQLSASPSFKEGNIAYKRHDYAQAIDCFTRAIASYAEEQVPAQLYGNRSAAYCGVERYAEALRDADSAIKQDPTWAKGHSRRANALHALGRLEEGRLAYLEALRLDPSNQLVRNSLQSLMETQRQGGGRLVLEQKRFRDMGNSAFAAQDYEQALRHYAEAVNLDPTDDGPLAHVLHSNVSAVYSSLGKWTEALRHGMRCMHLSPNFAKGHSRVGTAYANMHMYREAEASFEAALELEPDNQRVRESLERVRASMQAQPQPP